MRILITAAPFHGHLNPLLPLARAAQAAGHDVVVATGADLAQQIAGRGLPVWHIGPTRVESGMPRSLDDFWEAGERRALDLLRLAEGWRPDLVVAEEMEVGGAILAARTHTRLVVHGLGIAAAGDPTAFAPALAELGTRLAVPDLDQRYLGADYVSICPPTLEPPGPTRGKVLRVRPSTGEEAPGEQLPAALDRLPYQDTLHLTLGTVFHRRRPEALPTAIAGIRDLPVNLVVTLGPDVDAAHFAPQPPHVVLTDYLPHSLLLPRCCAVVSQGGAGILLGALAHGLPQLVLPQGADQYDNAVATARTGAGLVLDGEPSADKIRAAARLLLSDPTYTTAAGALRQEIAAMPSPTELLEQITH